MNNKINSISFLTMVYSLSTATFYGITSSYLFSVSNTSIIISMIIGYFISILISIIFLKFFSYKENLSFTNKIKHIYKKFHYIPNIIMILSSLLLYIVNTSRLLSFLSTQYLVETSRVLILVLIVFVTYYTASKGIETITRVTTISFFIAITIYFFIIYGLVRHIDLNNYLPILTISTNKIIYSSIVFSLFFTTPIFYMNSINKGNIVDKKYLYKKYFIMHFCSFFAVFSAILITLGVYGINLCNEFDYPLYTVLKKISLFNFIDSVENASIMLWIISSVNTSTIVLYFTIKNIKETFDVKRKFIDYLVIIISIIIPLLLFNKTTYLESYSYISIAILVTSIPIIICLFSLIIKKRY